MCTVVLAFHQNPDLPLLLAGNRDEFLKRSTREVHWWKDHPSILGGRDEEQNGTWFAVNRSGSFAVITNYREPGKIIENAPSRGWLVNDFLLDDRNPNAYHDHLKSSGSKYNGYNILFGNAGEVWYYSNRSEDTGRLEPGIYGLSNHLLDSPWPKVLKTKGYLEKNIDSNEQLNWIEMLKVFSNRSLAKDEELPSTGVPLEMERSLSALYIELPGYGTRTTWSYRVDKLGNAEIHEKSHHKGSAIHEQFTLLR